MRKNLMDYYLTKEQKILRKTIIQYIRENVNSILTYEHFTKAVWDKCAKGGLLAYNLNMEYGQVNFDIMTQMILTEAIGYACEDSGLVFAINNHLWACQAVIQKFGSKKIKNSLLSDMGNGNLIGCYAVTESGAGSDNNSMKTTFSVNEDSYIIKGSKTFISNAPIADVFVVIAKDLNKKSIDKYSAFVVKHDYKGVLIRNEISKMGLKGCPMSEIIFKDCKVPKDNLLGGLNNGVHIMNTAMEFERFFEFVSHIGAMRRLLKKCLDYVKIREQSDAKIENFQSVSNRIANIRMNIELAMNMAVNICNLMMNNKSVYLETAIFKLFVSEKYIEACRDAMQIHGAYGYSKESGFERELRDALGSSIYAGTNEIQQNIIYRMAQYEHYE